MAEAKEVPDPALRDLARLYGVRTGYYDVEGVRQGADPEVLVAVLRALGAPLTKVAEAAGAARARRLALWRRMLPPAAALWPDRSPRLRLRLPARPGGSGSLEIRLRTEDGGAMTRRVARETLPVAGARRVEGIAFETRTLALPPDLPPGHHRLLVRAGGREARCHLIRAPERAWEGDPRGWALFAPVWALRSRRRPSAGGLEELRRLAAWTAGRGGVAVATLPLFAAFLDGPVFEPGPYRPVSRLFWNEAYLGEGDGEGEPPGADGPDLVDWPRVARRVHERLDRDAAGFFARRGHRGPAFRRFLAARPDVGDYARFRGACAALGAPWREWPEPARAGRIPDGLVDRRVERRHLYAQWLWYRRTRRPVSGDAACLYLDLPVGVHPDGYDAWRERELFATGASVGAPPDPFFADGQEWGVPPPLPEAARREGYRYLRRSLERSMETADLLRVDHVMGLHRLYWVPSGAAAHEGVYVGYPADELYAVHCLASHRCRCALAGEDLGTVPEVVRRTMDRRGLRRTHVLRFALPAGEESLPGEVPPGSVASVGTHDMYPFTAWLEGHDIDDREALGHLEPEQAAAERLRRESDLRALEAGLEAAGLLPTDLPAGRRLLAGCLAWLGRSEAHLVVAGFDDLLGAREPVNVPGTSRERPNWRRTLPEELERVTEDPVVRRLLDGLDAARGRRAAPGSSRERG